MIRFLYTVLDLLAAVCAIVSPVAIVHWLLRAINAPPLAPLVAMLNPVFAPLNALVEFFIKTPPLQFQGEPVPTSQGVLAAVLTMAFFAFNFMSESLKAGEQKLNVTKENLQQRRRLEQLRAEKQKKERTITTNRRIFVHVNYDFLTCPQGGTFFETGYGKWGGRSLEVLPSDMSLEFDTLEHAFRYCLETSQQLLSYYSTLRPLDPQPSYKTGIHIIDKDSSTAEGIVKSKKLIKFAGDNQIIFTQEVKELMEALGITMTYNFQSQGMYPLEGYRNQELFRLMYMKKDRPF